MDNARKMENKINKMAMFEGHILQISKYVYKKSEILQTFESWEEGRGAS